MAIKITSFGGTDWINGDVLNATDLIATIEEAVPQASELTWNDLVFTGDTNLKLSILAHSATAWTAINGTNTVNTPDSGVNWNASTDNANMTGVSKVCDALKTSAISCQIRTGGNATFLATDSGDNWVGANTNPLNITGILDLSYPTTSVAVIACDFGTAASGIFFGDPSSGAGSLDWAASDFPAADCHAISMFDGSNGLAIHDNGSIYKTVNGGAAWTDGTFNVDGSNPNSSIVALTATTGVLLNQGSRTIVTFDYDSNIATTRLSIENAGEAQSFRSNLIQTTDGNLYFVEFTFSDAGDRGVNATLYRSTDSAVTWQQKSLGNNLFDADTDLTTNLTKSQLVEYDTNKLLIIIGKTQLMKLDVS